jgi:hypothetical protein
MLSHDSIAIQGRIDQVLAQFPAPMREHMEQVIAIWREERSRAERLRRERDSLGIALRAALAHGEFSDSEVRWHLQRTLAYHDGEESGDA